MIEESNYLFVYGTLLHGSNEFAIYLKQNCHFFDHGKLKGKLYDMGEYPGAIADENYKGYVYGSIFKLKNRVEVLKYLDDYEGFGEEQKHPNLFIRNMSVVETNSSLTNCWIYLYNLPIDAFNLIESGDYWEYINNS